MPGPSLSRPAFTLAELLIALAILGIIATFAISKVVSAQHNMRRIAVAKEAAASLSQALLLYKMQNGITAATRDEDLIPYLNYAKRDTTSIVDDNPPWVSLDCASVTCLLLHNGGTLIMQGINFGGTTDKHAIAVVFDTDNSYSGLPQGDALAIFLYTDGKVRTDENIEPDTIIGWGARPPGVDPGWFHW